MSSSPHIDPAYLNAFLDTMPNPVINAHEPEHLTSDDLAHTRVRSWGCSSLAESLGPDDSASVLEPVPSSDDDFHRDMVAYDEHYLRSDDAPASESSAVAESSVYSAPTIREVHTGRVLYYAPSYTPDFSALTGNFANRGLARRSAAPEPQSPVEHGEHDGDVHDAREGRFLGYVTPGNASPITPPSPPTSSVNSTPPRSRTVSMWSYIVNLYPWATSHSGRGVRDDTPASPSPPPRHSALPSSPNRHVRAHAVPFVSSETDEPHDFITSSDIGVPEGYSLEPVAHDLYVGTEVPGFIYSSDYSPVLTAMVAPSSAGADCASSDYSPVPTTMVAPSSAGADFASSAPQSPNTEDDSDEVDLAEQAPAFAHYQPATAAAMERVTPVIPPEVLAEYERIHSAAEAEASSRLAEAMAIIFPLPAGQQDAAQMSRGDSSTSLGSWTEGSLRVITPSPRFSELPNFPLPTIPLVGDKEPAQPPPRTLKVLPPIIGQKRKRGDGEDATHDRELRDELPEAARRCYIDVRAAGIFALGAAVGSIGTVAGLMSLAPQ